MNEDYLARLEAAKGTEPAGKSLLESLADAERHEAENPELADDMDRACPGCDGTGGCQDCTELTAVDCDSCLGSRECAECDGTGEIEDEPEPPEPYYAEPPSWS